jgi:hypothetical protein
MFGKAPETSSGRHFVSLSHPIFKPLPFRAFHYSASMPNFSYSQCSSPLLNSHLARHTGLLLWRLDPSHVTAGLTRSLSLNLTPNAHHLYPLPLPSRHTGPRAGASPSFQKRIIKKVPESSSGRHFVSLSHPIFTTPISCISLFRINAKFLLLTMLIAFTQFPSCPSHRPAPLEALIRCLSLFPKTNF